MTGRPIPDVNIEVVGTEVRVGTDLEGRYRTPPVATGTYTLQVSMLGYTTLRVDSVRVAAGDVTTLPLVLEPTAIELEEVVATVTSQRAATDAGLLAIRKNAAAVMDGISAEQISRSPDSDAADAIARVTGVSVVDDKFVVVRGLTERYSNTLLNGVELASPEPTRRIVPLDIFPTSLLESIVTMKTATPDLPGDFTGGLVNIQTKDFPEERVLELKVSQGYNSLTTFDQVPMLPRDGLGDLLGFDGNDRFRTPAEEFGVPEATALAKSIRNVWTPEPRTVIPDFGLSFQYGDQVGAFERALGYIISFDYGFETSYEPAELFSFANSAGDVLFETTTEHATTIADWGLIGNATLRLGPSHTIGIKNLVTQESEEFVVPLQSAFEIDPGSGVGPLSRRHQVRYIERGLLQTQLRGQHRFTAPFPTQWHWTITASRATRDEPENRTLTYSDPGDGSPFRLHTGNPDNIYRFRFFDDRIYGVNLDVSVPLGSWIADGEALFKAGFSGRWKHRDFDAFRLDLDPPFGGPPPDGREAVQLPPELITAPENIGRNLVVTVPTEFNLPYTSDDNVHSAYAMADLPLPFGLRAVGGVRLEQWGLDMLNLGPSASADSVTVRHEQDLLWSVNLTLPLNDQMNLRAAGYRTVSRPDARDIAVGEYKAVAGHCTEEGNPDLNRAQVINSDLRWEWYPAPGELISVTGFYKLFTDPMVQRVGIEQADRCNTRYINARTAYTSGGELELRKGLGFLHSLLNDVALGFNFTYADGGAEVPLGSNPNNNIPAVLLDLDLQDLSKYVANVSLSYSNANADLAATVLYNSFADRLTFYGDIISTNEKAPDIIEQGRGTFGFKVTKRFRGLTASLSGENITNEVVRQTQNRGDTGVVPVALARPGVSLSLSLGYAF